MTTIHLAKPKVAVLGAAAMDWVARVNQLPTRDGIVYANQYLSMPGGSGGNVAVGISRLGFGVRFLGVLGGDEGGRILKDAFCEAGVYTDAIYIDREQRSAACFIIIDEHGERMIVGLGGVALYEKPEQIQSDWLKDIQVLVIADAYVKTATTAIDFLDRNALVVFNPGGLMASAGSAYLKPIIERSGVLIVSQVEAEVLTGLMNIEQAAMELSRQGPAVVMATMGSRGVLVLEHGKLNYVASFPVNAVIDTTGAGDAFSSGVIAGYLDGLSWVDAARQGCATAAIKIGYLGSRGGLPDRKQVQAFIKVNNWLS